MGSISRVVAVDSPREASVYEELQVSFPRAQRHVLVGPQSVGKMLLAESFTPPGLMPFVGEDITYRTVG